MVPKLDLTTELNSPMLATYLLRIGDQIRYFRMTIPNLIQDGVGGVPTTNTLQYVFDRIADIEAITPAKVMNVMIGLIHYLHNEKVIPDADPQEEQYGKFTFKAIVPTGMDAKAVKLTFPSIEKGTDLNAWFAAHAGNFNTKDGYPVDDSNSWAALSLQDQRKAR